MKREFGILVTLMLVVASSAWGSTPNNWTNIGGNSLWSNGANWSAGVPNATHDVNIALGSAQNVQVDISAFCNSLTIGGVANPQSLTINNTSTPLSIASSCTIGSLGTITIVGISSPLTGGASITIQATGTLVALGPLNTTSNVTVQSGGIFNLAGGNVSGPPIINVNAPAGVFHVSNGGAIHATTVNNSGITNWDGAANFDLNTGATFNNLSGGLFNVSNSQHITNSSGPAATFTNTGMFTLSGSNTCTLDNNVSFTNNGQVTVGGAADTLVLNTFTNYSVATQTLTGGQYVLAGAISLPNVPGGKSIATNAANIVASTGSSTIKDGSGGSMFFGFANNSGQLSLSGGAAVGIGALGPITNSGAISISGNGTFISATGNFTQTGGTTTLLGGAQLTASGIVDLQGGALVAPTSSSINANVNNAAIIKVQSGQTLTINGTYTQTAAGSYVPFINSAAQFGVLAATSAATLNGTVNANILITYTTVPGDAWKVMTFASHAGQFSTVLPATTPNGQAVNQVVNAADITLQTGAAPPPPVISSATSSLAVAETNTPITFTAVATDPNGLPLTFTWNFGDGSPLAPGNPVNYAYVTEGAFTVTLTVSNPGSSATATLPITTFAPNSGGQGIPNIAQGGPDVIDPFTLLGIAVMSSDGGVIELGIDVSNLRAALNVSTDFAGIGLRSGAIPGLTPINKFTAPGVYVATATANDAATNAMKGKGRRTIAISGAEVGQPGSTTAPPKSSKLTKVKLKGKFAFAKKDSLQPLAGSGSDSVSMVGTVELPAGFDVGAKHEIDIAIGNIIDAMTVDAKGKAMLPGGGKVVKKLQIKYPKLKGSTKTTAGQTATVFISMSGSSFSANGFDTEGITNNVLPAEKAAKSINRSIQIAMVVEGTPYTLAAPVSFKLSKTADSGTMGTRTGP